MYMYMGPCMVARRMLDGYRYIRPHLPRAVGSILHAVDPQRPMACDIHGHEYH